MQDPQDVSNISAERITKPGYVFWRCQALNGEIIAVVKGGGFYQDRATDAAREAIKKGKLQEIPIYYTDAELRLLCETGDILLFHQAHKAGAKIESVEDEENPL